MPLRDHFRPPLSQRHSWEGVHGQWPALIVQQLTVLLPEEFTAEPRVHLGTQAEVDIATFESRGGSAEVVDAADNGGAATAVWSASQPTLAVETELADFDQYEVRVYDAQRERRLVAAIEIISPRNQDRPESRAQFVAKCAALLRSGVSLILVDVVTTSNFNLYAELLKWIGERDSSLGEIPPATSAVACRWRPHGARQLLEAWNCTLTLGEPLPTLPLWLTEELAISLDLDASYEQTCRDLRIV